MDIPPYLIGLTGSSQNIWLNMTSIGFHVVAMIVNTTHLVLVAQKVAIAYIIANVITLKKIYR